MRRTSFGIALVASAVIGCSRPTGAVPTGATPAYVAGDPYAGLPLDASITPVSRSAPSDAAKHALDACGFTAFDPKRDGVMMQVGLDVVSGIGLVPHGLDTPKYAPTGQLAELTSDNPVWVINTVGDISLPLGPTVRNAACIVYDGQWNKPYWVGGDEVENGKVTVSQDPKYAPSLHLPPLAP